MKQELDVGVIGLGKIGHGLARNLMRAGNRVHVLDIDSDKMACLVDEGATSETSAAAMAGKVEALLLSLVNAKIVEQVLFGAEGVCAGAPARGFVVIDTTTVSPQSSRQFARRLAAKGIAYLDSPVTGGPGGADKGTLYLMVGGEQDVYQRCAVVFDAVGAQSVLVGPTGCGSVAKMVNQLMMCAQAAGAAEAFLYAERHGADPAMVIQAINPELQGNPYVKRHEQQRLKGMAGDFRRVKAADDHFSPLFLKDMNCLLESEMVLPITQAAADMLATAIDGGCDGTFPWVMHAGLEAMQKGGRAEPAVGKGNGS